MTVCVVDGPIRGVDSQGLAGRLTIGPIIGTAVDGEVGGLVNESSGLGVGAEVRSVPEGTAQVDLAELVGIWSRDLSVTE